jgi:hypothetical protein
LLLDAAKEEEEKDRELTPMELAMKAMTDEYRMEERKRLT